MQQLQIAGTASACRFQLAVFFSPKKKQVQNAATSAVLDILPSLAEQCSKAKRQQLNLGYIGNVLDPSKPNFCVRESSVLVGDARCGGRWAEPVGGCRQPWRGLTPGERCWSGHDAAVRFDRGRLASVGGMLRFRRRLAVLVVSSSPAVVHPGGVRSSWDGPCVVLWSRVRWDADAIS